MIHQLDVTGMTCNHCRASVVRALSQVPGVGHVTVDLASGRATVTEANDVTVADASLIAAIEAQGYSARSA